MLQFGFSSEEAPVTSQKGAADKYGFVFNDRRLATLAEPVVSRLPARVANPIRIQYHPGLRDRRGAVHAGAFLRERRIAFDCTAGEFPRIFVHEVFHFAWMRLGNARRRSYELLLASEIKAGARGELGWSAEWRKRELRGEDLKQRTRRWRDYCCESFCDSAAWIYSGIGRHDEYTLGTRFRPARRRWFGELTEGRELSI